MSKRRRQAQKNRAARLIAGRREALERELFWAIALGGDRGRIAQLERMLTPAANDAFEATVLPAPAPGAD